VSNKETEQKIGELMDVMARLRGESGCPWDKEQTHVSLKPCLLEETYELLDALDDGEPLPQDTEAVLKQRLEIKAREKKDGAAKSALGNVPKGMPALARAQSITRRASHLGFDWPSIDPVWGKVEEEIAELKHAAASGDKARTGEELGDLLFSLVNLARFLDLEAEEALARTIDRFTRRFHYIETKLNEAGRSFDRSSLEEMDTLWEEAKSIEAREKTSP